VAPVVLFCPDSERASVRSYDTLRHQIPRSHLITVENEHVLRDDLPELFTRGRLLRVPALPLFLKTYIDRMSFSFTDYLRREKDSSTELHQWIRRNYYSLRELELELIPQRS
jgi:hypothetical protein